MNRLLEILLEHTRPVLLILAFFLVAGAYSYVSMPKEAQPDVVIPIIIVEMSHEGISPEDGERLLIRPMETELRAIEGVKEMTSKAREGVATIVLEFDAGFDNKVALEDVRAAVDLGEAELPSDTDKPEVREISFALFPALVVGLSGDIPQRTLLQLARDLEDKIEGIPAVLEVDIAGDREDLVEILVDPAKLETYELKMAEVIQFVANNNKLVPAGTMDVGVGRIPVKVPGLYEDVDHILNTPVKVDGDRVIRMSDVATIRQTYKDPSGYARLQGRPAIALEVKKRVGENVIETIEAVKAIVHEEMATWPAGVEVEFFQDSSDQVRDMLRDLQNNLISAISLVMLVIFAALGGRSAALVGVAIPGSFLMGLFVLNLFGLTINIVVLFSLILAVGMLVDGAIVVVEFADRKMAEGAPRQRAYLLASQRVALPILSSTLTTLAAFAPLLFWPGIVGEFMKYLPLTLIATLTASLFMALIFVPSLGALFGKAGSGDPKVLGALAAAEGGDLEALQGFTGWYVRSLHRWLKHPWRVVGVIFLFLVLVYGAKVFLGKGVEFFPSVEPEFAYLNMRVRGNLSIEEMDAELYEIEKRIIDMPELKTVYARSGVAMGGGDISEDTHGRILFEFVDWRYRRNASEIMEEMRERVKGIPGIVIEIDSEKAGPPVGKPVQIQLSSRYPELLDGAVEVVVAKFNSLDALKDIEDSRPEPGIEWLLEVDRIQSSRFGANISSVGNIVQFVTTGVLLGEYRPDFTDEEVELRVRYPLEYRNISELETLRIPTAYGLVPLSNFVDWSAAPKVGFIERVDSKRAISVKAGVKDGYLADDQVKELRRWLEQDAEIDASVVATFKGEDEEQQEAQAFLMRAFLIALAIMAIILVAQFNNFYYAFLILTAVVFSTVGVFLGLLITGQAFSIVMNGIGVVALAGIVVNNNIVLIDTYAVLKRHGLDTYDAVLRTGAQRLRPVLLTTVTTILGLVPMVIGLNIDFIDREITMGAPSTQWWKQLSISIAFGLAFATVLTLVLTPAMLVIGEGKRSKSKK